MSFLLINKYRNKFGVRPGTDSQLDKFIENTVYQFLKENKQATENGLKYLDKQLSDEVLKIKGPETA